MRSTCSFFARLATLGLVAVAGAPLHATLHAQINAVTDSASAPAAGTRDSIVLTAMPIAAPVSQEAPVARSGAPMTGLRSAAHVRETAGPLRVNAANHANLGQSRAMMVVGAAALITGAIIGGDPGTIIMVGGAVIGLYGLYTYLQ